jgi:acyl-[acyl-carrier-protein]-phospholipid O-acyltransferase/long-chain-fatty-acid--[acyl-carrier-protein] ligase
MVPHEALEAAIMNIWNLDPADEERRIAVVTIPDPVKGEAVALLTTLVTDYVHQARTLIRHGLIDQGLPALWCPKEIIPVERIPVLPSGKLDIKQCRMLAYEALNIPFEP